MTDDGARLGYQPNLDYFKDRSLAATERSQEALDIADQTILPQMVAELNRKVNGVLGKINKLQEEIKRTARPFIPVHKKAHEVRYALQSLFPEGQDDIITLDQYIEALQWNYRRTSVNLDQLINTVTGNTEVDSRIIDEMQWDSSDNLPPEELAIIAGQFMLVKMTNKIMKPYNASDAADIAAPKLYPGTERAPATAQILIGLAALLLQIAENREAVEKAIAKTLDDFGIIGDSADEIVNQAVELGRDPEIDEWKKTQRPYYWDVIVRYVQDYLNTTVETGYEGWQIYESMEGHKSSLTDMEAEFDHYGRTAEEAESSPWQLGLDMYRMMFFQTADSNEQTDLAATILSSQGLKHRLCCLVVFAGAIPTEQLKLFRFALSIQANGLNVDLGAALETGRNKVNSFLAERVLEPVLHKIDRFFAKYSQEALQILDRNNWDDKELYDIMMACTPVDQAIEYALRGLEKLKRKLVELLMRVWQRLELKSVKGNWTWRVMADSKSCLEILSVIDAIIEAVERGNLCAREGGNTPTVEEIEEFVNRFSVNLPTAIAVETEGDPFEVFNIKPFVTSTGMTFPEAPEDEATSSVDDTDTGIKRFRIEDCLRNSSNPREILKAIGLSVQLDRDLRDARNVERSRPAS